MSSDKSLPNARGTALSVNKHASRNAVEHAGLSLTEFQRDLKSQQSSDPYNSSGSFDRKKHWARVGKR
jgi:hypothetical protein